jgi:hypothetical protein
MADPRSATDNASRGRESGPGLCILERRVPDGRALQGLKRANPGLEPHGRRGEGFLLNICADSQARGYRGLTRECIRSSGRTQEGETDAGQGFRVIASRRVGPLLRGRLRPLQPKTGFFSDSPPANGTAEGRRVPQEAGASATCTDDNRPEGRLLAPQAGSTPSSPPPHLGQRSTTKPMTPQQNARLRS